MRHKPGILEDAKSTGRRLQELLREALTLTKGLAQAERVQDAGVGDGAGEPSRFRIERYGQTRFWALYEGERLLAVTIYKKGAQAVAAPAPPALIDADATLSQLRGTGTSAAKEEKEKNRAKNAQAKR